MVKLLNHNFTTIELLAIAVIAMLTLTHFFPDMGFTDPSGQQPATSGVVVTIHYADGSSTHHTGDPLNFATALASVINDGKHIAAIDAAVSVSITFSGTPSSTTMTGSLQVQLDAVTHRTIALTFPTSAGSYASGALHQVATTTVFASDIETWDAGAFATHTLAFLVDDAQVTILFEDGVSDTHAFPASSATITDVTVQSDSGITGGDVIIDGGTVTPTTFHGVTMKTHYAADYWGSNGYTAIDYQNVQRWGLNTVVFEGWWGHLEEDELQVGVYNTAFLTRLDTQIQHATDHGLYPFIAVRTTYGPDRYVAWRGWTAQYSYDYVNLNQPDASGALGRDRLIALLQMLAQRYPQCGICVTFFPYHSESPATTQVDALYTTTIPTLISAVRTVSDEYILFHPSGQGQDAVTTTGQYSILESYGYPLSDAKVIYGYNNHGKDDNNNVVNGAAWTYDTATLQAHYAPLIDFLSRHDVPTLCAESTPLDVHSAANSYRPIDPSRLDWLETHFQTMAAHNLGWSFYVYQRDSSWSSPIDADGSDNAIATLLSQYS